MTKVDRDSVDLTELAELWRAETLDALSDSDIQYEIGYSQAKRLHEIASSAEVATVHDIGRLINSKTGGKVFFLPVPDDTLPDAVLPVQVEDLKIDIPIGVVAGKGAANGSLFHIRDMNVRALALNPSTHNNLPIEDRVAVVLHELVHADQYQPDIPYKDLVGPASRTRLEAQAYDVAHRYSNVVHNGQLEPIVENLTGVQDFRYMFNPESFQGDLPSGIVRSLMTAVVINRTFEYTPDGKQVPSEQVISAYYDAGFMS